MPRVKGTVSATCTFNGCNERGFTEYEGAADRTKAEQWRIRWRCVRHTKDGADVLSPSQRSLTTVLVACEEDYGVIWRPEGQEDRGGFGLVTGPGFKAFSSDWPVGTRLKVTAEIVGKPTSIVVNIAPADIDGAHAAGYAAGLRDGRLSR